MATRTFTSAGVNNLWSNAANWDTAPVDNDTVVIASGQTCEFDADLSGWANGVAGLTITGTLKLTRTAGTYYLKIKAATTITGAGTFDCGASAGDAIPFAAKHTITGGAAWYINGASGLTMTVFAAEPAIKTVLLTGTEAIGATVIDVDTDVTGDIWADGDTIRIDDINNWNESEERVIAAGGIAAGAITITAGLTAAKSAGAVLSLMSRNVKFIGVGATAYVNQNFASAKLTVAGGQWVSAYRIFYFFTNATISGGTFQTTGYVFYACVTVIVTGGVFSGSDRIFYNSNPIDISGGSFSGNGIIFSNVVYGATISGGVFKGNGDLFVGGVGHVIFGGTFYGIRYIANLAAEVIINGGTFSNNTAIFYASSATVKNAVFDANTYDINSSKVTCFNVTFGANENTGYTSLSESAYSESLDHDATAGAFKSWTKGGVTTSQAGTVPTGYTSAMQTVLENATNKGFWQKEYTVGAGASVNITMNLRKSASMTYLPRCIIFNKAATDPFAGGAGIHTFTMTNSVDTWEAETYTYYNSTANDVTLVIRFQGMNATGNMFSALLVEQINVDLTSVINALAVVDANVDAILVDTGTDIPATLTTIDGIVDDILVDTGTTLPATLATIDGIVDDILVDTGTTLPAAIAAVDTDVLAAVVEGTFTVQDILKFSAAVLAGASSGGGTSTITFRDLSNLLDRVVATVDSNGNRTVVLRDNS